jgi:two-component system nitrogen regulation response regulator GlnG
MSRILIVDDEPAIGWSLREVLSDEGHAVEVAASVEAGLETCARIRPEAMLLDVRLPGRDGLSALPDFKALVPDAPVVVMTAFGDLDTAVRAVKAGAFDYLVKPFDLDRVSQVMARALAEHAQPAPAAAPAGGRAQAVTLVGSSPPMQAVFNQIALAAATDLPVLVTGETGTGKELVARAIHAHGARRDQPLVTTSLAALSPSVVESELFGHVKGAFTGATADRKGLFELADGGTIFLDEIGEASPELQVKLLRILEHGELVPVGSADVQPIDVRIVAATNRDLTAARSSGAFRADLYHRLKVFPIEMPPLADRMQDVPALVECFLQATTGAPARTAPEFLAAIQRRRWPGNVRELKHAVEYAAVMARGGTLRPEHLPPETPAPPPIAGAAAGAEEQLAAAVRAWVESVWLHDAANSGDLHERLARLMQSTLAEDVMARCGGNLTAAAKALGLDRATLRTKLQR